MIDEDYWKNTNIENELRYRQSNGTIAEELMDRVNKLREKITEILKEVLQLQHRISLNLNLELIKKEKEEKMEELRFIDSFPVRWEKAGKQIQAEEKSLKDEDK